MTVTVWGAFKGLITCILMLLAGLIFAAVIYTGDPSVLGYGFGLLFLASLIWVDYSKPNTALAFVVLGLALYIGFYVINALIGQGAFPQNCTGRRGFVLCNIENVLYQHGGRVAAAMPLAIMFLSMIYATYVAFKRARDF